MIEVRVNGEAFDGFEQGAIQLTMDEAASSFDLTYVADGKQPGARVIFEGDAVTVALDDGGGPEVIIDGYVDTVDDEDNEDLVRLSCAGRSKAGDLVDCSATRDPGSWTNATLDKIAKDLCAPFGVKVIVDGSVGKPFPNFAIQQGESPYEAISRGALKRGLFAYSVVGDLVLAKAGSYTTKTALVRGEEPLLRSARTNSWISRFSEYRFLGQVRSTDNNFGKASAHLKGVINDEAITRFRPLRVVAQAYDGVDLETRAKMERNQRAGRGERITALVDGWLTAEGKVWRPNTLVAFRNNVLGVDATLLVTTARFRLAANEPRQTELYLCRPEAYASESYPVIQRGDAWT